MLNSARRTRRGISKNSGCLKRRQTCRFYQYPESKRFSMGGSEKDRRRGRVTRPLRSAHRMRRHKRPGNRDFGSGGVGRGKKPGRYKPRSDSSRTGVFALMSHGRPNRAFGDAGESWFAGCVRCKAGRGADRRGSAQQRVDPNRFATSRRAKGEAAARAVVEANEEGTGREDRHHPLRTDRGRRVRTYRFSEGLVGFRNLTQFVLIPDPVTPGLSWLQSASPEIAFGLVAPPLAASDYRIEMRPGDRSALELDDERQAMVYVILNRGDAGGLNVNLQGPLVLHPARRLGRQLVLTSSSHAVRFPLEGIWSALPSTIPAVVSAFRARREDWDRGHFQKRRRTLP